MTSHARHTPKTSAHHSGRQGRANRPRGPGVHHARPPPQGPTGPGLRRDPGNSTPASSGFAAGQVLGPVNTTLESVNLATLRAATPAGEAPVHARPGPTGRPPRGQPLTSHIAGLPGPGLCQAAAHPAKATTDFKHPTSAASSTTMTCHARRTPNPSAHHSRRQRQATRPRDPGVHHARPPPQGPTGPGLRQDPGNTTPESSGFAAGQAMGPVSTTLESINLATLRAATPAGEASDHARPGPTGRPH